MSAADICTPLIEQAASNLLWVCGAFGIIVCGLIAGAMYAAGHDAGMKAAKKRNDS